MPFWFPKYCLLIIFSALFTAWGCAQNTERIVDAQKMRQVIDRQQDTRVILDVRTPQEVAGGVIPGAVHLDYHRDDFSQMLSQLDKEMTYYVYCHSGVRSAWTADMMEEMGFKQVYDYKGGMQEWKELAYPLE